MLKERDEEDIPLYMLGFVEDESCAVRFNPTSSGSGCAEEPQQAQKSGDGNRARGGVGRDRGGGGRRRGRTSAGSRRESGDRQPSGGHSHIGSPAHHTIGALRLASWCIACHKGVLEYADLPEDQLSRKAGENLLRTCRFIQDPHTAEDAPEGMRFDCK